MIKIFSCAVLLATFAGCNVPEGSSVPSPAQRASAVAAATASATAAALVNERNAKIAECKTSLPAKVAEYRKLMATRSYWPATIEIRQCAELLEDSKLKLLVAEGEIKSYVQDIESPKVSDFDRIRSGEALLRDYPDRGQKYSKRIAELAATLDRRREANEVSAKKARTPKIGSTMRDVIDNSWGYPSSTNKTTAVNGTTEQWVYGSGKYLYFDNGILTAVQE